MKDISDDRYPVRDRSCVAQKRESKAVATPLFCA